MNSKKLVIIGAGEFAEIAYEYFTYDSEYTVVGFGVEQEYLQSEHLCGLPVLSLDQMQTRFSPEEASIFVAITFTGLNRVRTRLLEELKGKGYVPASYISSKAFVWRNATLGEHCFVFENNVIQHHATIGNNVVLWSGNHLGHRCSVGDNCFVSSHVVISGYCKIGRNCFLGVNSTVNDQIEIADDCFISSACLVNRDTEPGGFYMGNPGSRHSLSTYRKFKIDPLSPTTD